MVLGVSSKLTSRLGEELAGVPEHTQAFMLQLLVRYRNMACCRDHSKRARLAAQNNEKGLLEELTRVLNVSHNQLVIAGRTIRRNVRGRTRLVGSELLGIPGGAKALKILGIQDPAVTLYAAAEAIREARATISARLVKLNSPPELEHNRPDHPQIQHIGALYYVLKRVLSGPPPTGAALSTKKCHARTVSILGKLELTNINFDETRRSSPAIQKAIERLSAAERQQLDDFLTETISLRPPAPKQATKFHSK